MICQRKPSLLLLLLGILYLLCSAPLVYGENASVVFECGDIGVEARRVLANLKEERQIMQKRKKALEKREGELKILEQEVDKKIKQLQEFRKELSEMLAKKDNIEAEKVKKLSQIYQKREPAGAAQTLAAMEKSLAVAVLAGMRDKYAGEILDNMDAEKAREYSTALGRMGK